jgi:spermidine/putrescine transport system substrate-binding protein
MDDRGTSRRTVLKALGGGAGLLSMPYIIRPRPAWAQSNVLNITTYEKFIPQEFIDQFQADTGITVQVRLTDDQGKQYNLVAAEAGSPTTDIVTVAGHRFAQWVDADLLAPVDPARMTNWKGLNPTYQNAEWLKINGNLYGVPILAGFRGTCPQHGVYRERRQLEHHVRPQVQGHDVLYCGRLPVLRHALSRL